VVGSMMRWGVFAGWLATWTVGRLGWGVLGV